MSVLLAQFVEAITTHTDFNGTSVDNEPLRVVSLQDYC